MSHLFLSASRTDKKVQDGTLILTTHRILYLHGGAVLEIPLHFIKSHATGGGMMHSPRIEVFLARDIINQGAPPYEVEYHQKVLHLKGKPEFTHRYAQDEYQLKQFASKDARA